MIFSHVLYQLSYLGAVPRPPDGGRLQSAGFIEAGPRAVQRPAVARVYDELFDLADVGVREEIGVPRRAASALLPASLAGVTASIGVSGNFCTACHTDRKVPIFLGERTGFAWIDTGVQRPSGLPITPDRPAAVARWRFRPLRLRPYPGSHRRR